MILQANDIKDKALQDSSIQDSSFKSTAISMCLNIPAPFAYLKR